MARVLKECGWRRAVTVSKRSGCITKGHGAWLAAAVAGLTECPVVFQDYATEAEELEDLIADNALARKSRVDNGRMAAARAKLALFGIESELAGFPKRVARTRRHWNLIVECRDVAHQRATAERLTARGFTVELEPEVS